MPLVVFRAALPGVFLVVVRGWDVDHAGWVVNMGFLERQEFYGRAIEEALTWYLVWLIAPEIGVGPFRV